MNKIKIKQINKQKNQMLFENKIIIFVKTKNLLGILSYYF
jgi:hypothetical protein